MKQNPEDSHYDIIASVSHTPQWIVKSERTHMFIHSLKNQKTFQGNKMKCVACSLQKLVTRPTPIKNKKITKIS